MPPGASNTIGKRGLFWIVFMTVTVLLVGGSWWVANFVRTTVVEAAAEEVRLTNGYINYWIGQGYITDEATAAVQAYIEQFPEPQNVEVLVGLNTSEIWSYMTSQVAGGLQVNCTHCHVLDNFGAETLEEYEALGGDETMWQNKKTARAMLQMSQDLNQNWITQLADIEGKQPSGAQITCATCHNGQAQFETWSAEQHALPNDYRLPLLASCPLDEPDCEIPEGTPGTVEDIDRALVITGNDVDYSLDQVQYNQHTMTYMNWSIGIGCTHCHNSRYFPSWEQPAKYYAYTMLQMTQHLQNEYYEEWFNGKEPSCFMCHQNQVRPPGAIESSVFLPDMMTSEYQAQE